MAERKVAKKTEKAEKKVDKKQAKTDKVKRAKEKKIVNKEIKIQKVKTEKKIEDVGKNKTSFGENTEVIHLKPLVTEKAVMLIESQNVMTFETSINARRDQIKSEVEDVFETKVEDVRTLIRNRKKYAYVKLNAKTPAIDIATKLGMI